MHLNQLVMENLYLFEKEKPVKSKLINLFKKLINLLRRRKKVAIFSLIFLSLFFFNQASAANRFSVATGNWNSTSTWSATSGGASGASIPVASDNVTIEGGYTVTLSTSNTANLNSLTISSGAALTTSSNRSITASTFTVNGTYNNGSSGAITATITINGTYNHTSNADNFPTATWAATSNCNITGLTSVNLFTFPLQTYGNVTYNCTGQTGSVDLLDASGTTTIQGNLTIQSTGSGTLYFRLSGQIHDPVILTINGNFNISGGTTDADNNGGTPNTQVQIFIGGNFNQTGGVFNTSTSQPGVNCVMTFTGTTSTFTQSGGTFNTGSSRFNFIVASGATLTLNSNLTLVNGYGITVNSGGTLIVPTGVTLNTTAGTLTNNGTISGAGTITNYVQPGTYTDLTISGSGIWTTVGVTVNGILSMEGTATISDAITFGSNATLQYNTSTARTVGVEWISNFSGTGGIIIANTGAITMNSAEVVYTSLTINSGATFRTNNFNLTISGDLLNNGTFTPGNSTINYNNATGGQTVAAASYKNLTLGNTSGEQIAAGNISVSTTFITTAGGTFNLGNNTLSGTLTTLTNNGIIRTQNTGTAITAGKTWGGTVQYDGVAQTVSNGTYNNLTLSGSGIKTKSTGTTTVNGVLSLEGTATLSAALSYGGAATLQYNTSTARTAGVEWLSPFTASGGILITNTGEISISIGKIVNAPVSVNNGASLNLVSYILSGTGSFTLNAGAGIVIGNVAGITTSGLTGSIQVSGTRTYDNAANYTYAISASQVFGNGFPSTVNNLTINNGNTSMALLGSLIINGTLTISNGKIAIGANTLTLNGDFTGTSTNSLKGNGNSSNLTISGSGTIGLLYFDQTTNGTTNTVQNLTINRTTQTVTLGNTLQITGVVTPTAGTLASGGNLVIVSNSIGTARIAAIPAGADITGNVTVQRYLPAITRRYRMLSSPDQNFTWSQIKDNMFVTGTGGATNGFDATPTNSASCYTYQESTSGGRGWKAATNITNSVSSAVGTLVFVRGDRTLASPNWYTGPSFVAQNAVTVDFTNQPINKGNYTPGITYTNTGIAANDGWNLVGNPYPSQIDWSLLSKSNLSSFFYIFNPTTGSYVAANTGIIASGQAFFVQATTASPSITFTESAKTSSTAAYYFKTAPTRLQVEMIKDSINSDVAWLDFNPSSSKAFNNNEDALKYNNAVVNVGFYIDSLNTTQFNSVPMPLVADTFILSANAAAGTYTLQFTDIITSLPSSKNIYLLDLYNSNLIDLRTTSSYSFTITSSSATSGNRFMIIINDPSTLPVSWLSFNGEIQNTTDVLLKWETANEKNNSHFVIERSDDNIEYSEIGLLKATGNSIAATTYNFVDKNIFNRGSKTIFYRLKQIDLNGNFDYSKTISMSTILKAESTNVSVYPNPANDFINVKLISKNKETATIELFDITGKVISFSTSSIAKDATRIDTQNLQNGIYFLRVTSQQNVTTTKFIKE